MLKAIVEGRPLIACDLDDARWIELQGEDRKARNMGATLIVCPGCGGPMHTRKLQPPYLTQTFIHNPGAAKCAVASMWAGESDDHKSLKAQVFSAIQNTKGWMGDVEVIFGSGDAKVDVVATRVKDRRNQGFEVQLAPEPTDRILDRQRKSSHYLHGNHWIVRQETAWSLKVPTYRIATIDATEMVVAGVYRWQGGRFDGNYIPIEPIPMPQFTKLLLRGRMDWVQDVGLIDLRGGRQPHLKPTKPKAEGGAYVSTQCDRPPVALLPRRKTGSKTVDRIIGELDDHYLRHPGQWPFDSDRARRFPQRDPNEPG